MQYEIKTTTKIGEPETNFKINEVVIYENKERKIICIDYIENLYGLEPIWEPENVIWVRQENCTSNHLYSEVKRLENILKNVKVLLIEDVPHQYQNRLLDILYLE